MFAIYYSPHPALSNYVETICIMGHNFITDEYLSPIYTFMPSHTRFICFYLEDLVAVQRGDGHFKTRSRALIIGPQITPVTMDLGRKHTEVVVVLKPGGLYRLLGIPLSEMVDCDFDASFLLGKEINNVVEQLVNTIDNLERNKIIQNYLLSKLDHLKTSLPIDHAISKLVQTQGKMSMDILASSACLISMTPPNDFGDYFHIFFQN